ncbi:uncharacterized protein FIBRA_01883 [Fibroporia radiculosa]|uniref:BTB domain-containing protein n=1 Tax=Fibroporia radiculosa TaxID=599839 RepID=J4G184_9APHY|nr:uncharacterized protein FIBRA_01883 [Fibroporia radiculosa]CCL99858.1 predicted protein [Fibroporia radiculosa]
MASSASTSRHAQKSSKKGNINRKGPQRPPTFTDPLPPTKDAVLRVALKTALAGGEFIDTKIYTYSRRAVSGAVDRPRPVYANSTTLKATSEFFVSLLSGGFAESRMESLDADLQSGEEGSTDLYEYHSDSDLEDEVVDGDEDVAADAAASTQLNSKADGTGDDAAAATGDDRVGSPGGVEFETARALSLLGTDRFSTASSSSIAPATDNTRRFGRTVFLKNVAFKTLQAFIFYVFTGEVKFASLKSQLDHLDEGQPEVVFDSNSSAPPSCSPKSMYRLAEMCGIKELQELALNDIKMKLSSKNILDELFSTFTSWYPDVEQAELDFLTKGDIPSDVVAVMPRVVGRMAASGVPHGGHVITALLKVLVASHNGRSTHASSNSQLQKELADTKASLEKARQCPNGHNRTAQTQVYCNNCGTYYYV